mgnify:CR=1|tara:strand:+ start:174 stop:494 length:321 start_codon:yes stop_codon:yes gene_type:complete
MDYYKKAELVVYQDQNKLGEWFSGNWYKDTRYTIFHLLEDDYEDLRGVHYSGISFVDVYMPIHKTQAMLFLLSNVREQNDMDMEYNINDMSIVKEHSKIEEVVFYK